MTSLFSRMLTGVLDIDRSADAVEFDRRWYSWGELADTIAAIRAALDGVGLRPDMRIGVMVRNRPPMLAALLAAVAADACIVTINLLLPDDALAADLRRLELPVLIGEAADLDRSGVMGALADTGTAAVEVEPGLSGAVLRRAAMPSNDTRAIEPGVIIEMLTSGTTGPPKRVPLKRAAFEKSFVAAQSYERGGQAEAPPRLRSGVTILSGPMTHIGGLWTALACVLAGRKACLLEKFSVAGWHDAIVRHRPKVAAAVPAALRMILEADIPKEDLASLVAIRTGASPLDQATLDAFWERYRIPVLQNYGATEFSGAVAGWTMQDFEAFRETKGASVGRFQPGVAGRIIDPGTDAQLGVGEEGVLEVRSEQFGNDGAWLRTTDRALIDTDGFLFIRGRADNAIVRGGFKVHPDDVAAALEQHDAVREAVVVGLPDPRLGEVPVAAVMLRAGADAPADGELAAFARTQLLPYQVPTRFLIVDEVPRTESMKPLLADVRALFKTD